MTGRTISAVLQQTARPGLRQGGVVHRRSKAQPCHRPTLRSPKGILSLRCLPACISASVYWNVPDRPFHARPNCRLGRPGRLVRLLHICGAGAWLRMNRRPVENQTCSLLSACSHSSVQEMLSLLALPAPSFGHKTSGSTAALLPFQ